MLTLLALTLAADWPRFRGPDADGHTPDPGLAADWATSPPAEVWSKPVGGGLAGPVTAGGNLYLFHAPDGREVLDALDPATGTQKWRADAAGTGEGPKCTPIVHAGAVFTLGLNGRLTAFDAATGSRTWSRDILNEFSPRPGYFGVGAGPVVLGDVLIVNVGAKGAGLVGFDLKTGATRWQVTDDGPGYSSPTPLTLAGRPHAAFLTRAGLAAVDAAGKVFAQQPFRSRLDASANAASPVAKGDEVFVSAEYGVGGAVFKLAAGAEPAEVWANGTSLNCHFNTPVLVGDHLYGVHGRQEGRPELRCVEWASGKVKWANDGFGCAHLIVAGGAILAVTEDGGLVKFAADPAGYKLLGQTRILGGLTRAAPAVSGGRLFARDDGTLTCWK
jgi:outer membrane protein assembly factor BamB